MMKHIWIILLSILLVLAAGCDTLTPATSTQAPETASPTATVEATAEPSPAATPAPATPTASPGIAAGSPTIQWELEEVDVTVNVPEAWKNDTSLVEILSENPDIERMYAVAFVPEGMALPQDANLGYFYVIKESIWDSRNGVIADNPINELGRANEYVIGYTGSRDNPYVLNTPECDLFDELMVPTQGAMNVLSVAE